MKASGNFVLYECVQYCMCIPKCFKKSSLSPPDEAWTGLLKVNDVYTLVVCIFYLICWSCLIIRMRETVIEMATGCLRMVKIDVFVLNNTMLVHQGYQTSIFNSFVGTGGFEIYMKCPQKTCILRRKRSRIAFSLHVILSDPKYILLTSIPSIDS